MYFIKHICNSIFSIDKYFLLFYFASVNALDPF
jgi:hypothetical protein